MGICPFASAKPKDRAKDMAVASKATVKVFSMVSSSLGWTVKPYTSQHEPFMNGWELD